MGAAAPLSRDTGGLVVLGGGHEMNVGTAGEPKVASR